MNQTSIFEYLDNLQLYQTDPLQKQLDYYSQKKLEIFSQQNNKSLEFQSPKYQPKNIYSHLQIKKTHSQQEIPLKLNLGEANKKKLKKSPFESIITLK